MKFGIFRRKLAENAWFWLKNRLFWVDFVDFQRNSGRNLIFFSGSIFIFSRILDFLFRSKFDFRMKLAEKSIFIFRTKFVFSCRCRVRRFRKWCIFGMKTHLFGGPKKLFLVSKKHQFWMIFGPQKWTKNGGDHWGNWIFGPFLDWFLMFKMRLNFRDILLHFWRFYAPFFLLGWDECF